MLTDKNLDSLVSKLSENLRALQSTCSEFKERSNFGANEGQAEFSPRFKEIETFVINLKNTLTLCPDIIQNTKNSCVKLRLMLKEFPNIQKVDLVQKQLTEAARHLINLELSHLTSIDYKLDQLLELIINKEKFDQVYIRNLEKRLCGKETALSPKSNSFKKSSSVNSCSNCAKLSEEFQLITEKMQNLMNKIQISINSFNPNLVSEAKSQKEKKKVEGLKTQIKRLQAKILEYEDKEMQSMKNISNLSSSIEEVGKLESKLEESQEKLAKKDSKMNQLIKIIEELNKEKKKIFESAAGLKEQLEKKVSEQDDQIKNLEDDYISQIKSLRQKLLKYGEMEKTNKYLHKEVITLKSSYETAIKNLQDNESKLIQKSLQVEKSSHLSNFISEKDLLIKSLEQNLESLKLQVFEKENKIQELQQNLSSSQKSLEASKSNLENLFSEYDLLKNSSKQEIDSLKLQFSPRSSISKEKSRELDSISVHYFSQINELQHLISEQKEELNILNSKIDERDEYIKELESKTLVHLTASNHALKADNKSLIESQTLISDYLAQAQTDYVSQIEDLKQQLNETLEEKEELSRMVKGQHYLYNNIDKQRNSINSSGFTSRVLTRQNTSPAVAWTQFKSVDALKKLFENQDFDPEVMVKIGVELDEEDPNKFVERIMEIKRDRDSLYLAAEKYEDLILELKEELEEENENQLLACVIKLKEQIEKNNKSVN